MSILHEARTFNNNYRLVGVYDIGEWIPTAWGGPSKPGEYLTADGKGNTKILYTTGDTNRMKDVLFERFEDICWYGGVRLTDSEIVKLAFDGFDTWYTIEPDYSLGGYDGEILVIFRKENEPKYWLKGSTLTGPIDDELDKCPVHRTDYIPINSNSERFDENGKDIYDSIPLLPWT